MIDNEQEAPPYLYIDEEKVDVKKDGSFEFPLFTLDDTEITVLAVDRRGIQDEKLIKIKVKKKLLLLKNYKN